jgi:hypothetical protein
MSCSPHSCPQLASARPATSARHARTGGVFRDACVPLLRPRFLRPGIRTLGRSAPPCLTVRDDHLAVRDSVDAWDGVRPDRGAAKEKADRFRELVAIADEHWSTYVNLKCFKTFACGSPGLCGTEQRPFEFRPGAMRTCKANVSVLDLTKLRAGDALNHGKFAESPEVVQLIGKRLAEGQTVTDSRVGLGDRIIQVTAGAATAVGTAAGMVVSAPVAIVDPQTRQTLSGHVEELGQSASSVVAP